MKYMMSVLLILLLFTDGHAPPRKEIIIIMPLYLPPVEEIDMTEQRINDLELLHPVFRNKVVMLLYEAAKQGIELEVVETYRTPERQNTLRRKGFSMLHGGKSKHQHHIAIDVVPVKFGWYMWHDKELWARIGKIGKAQGLVWGGDWKRFSDFPHFEYKISIDSIKFIPLPDTVIIPFNYE